MREKEIKVVCKRCGKSAPMDKIVLDPVYKMMVCPVCVAERKEKEKNPASSDLNENAACGKQKARPAGWDYEDEFLVQSSKEKKMSSQRIDDTRTKCICHKCKYNFVYDNLKKHPNVCPYCGTDVVIK